MIVLTPQLASRMLDIFWRRQNEGAPKRGTLLQEALARLETERLYLKRRQGL